MATCDVFLMILTICSSQAIGHSVRGGPRRSEPTREAKFNLPETVLDMIEAFAIPICDPEAVKAEMISPRRSGRLHHQSQPSDVMMKMRLSPSPPRPSAEIHVARRIGLTHRRSWRPPSAPQTRGCDGQKWPSQLCGTRWSSSSETPRCLPSWIPACKRRLLLRHDWRQSNWYWP